MKKIATYILGVIALSMASCITLEDNFAPVNKGGVLSVMASVADFSTVNVGTKSGENDSHVDSLTMILFDKNGNLLGKPIYMGDINSSFTIDPKNGRIIDGTEAILLIPEGKQESEYNLTACSIYMVANATDVLREKIKEDQRITESAFLDINIPVPSIGIPEDGIPMIGKYDKPVDLSDAASDATVANVTMKKLYAKVNVRFQVNAIQVADIPSFTINNWTVRNIPKFVRLGEQENAETIWANSEEDKESKVFDATPSTELTEGNHTIYHDPSSKDYFQFTFYVPEHKVQPDITFPYPSGIKPDEKQRYKPLLCSENRNPMYVTVNGEYVDHNSIVKGVTYSLYLGQNNSDNFEVKRNQELNNFITIKGLTNNKAAAGTEEGESQFNISVDHRVDVNFDGFSLSIEREAILDSHFEVRPLDITLSPNSSMTITIPDDYQSWIAMEDDSTGLKTPTSAYITGKGVRKYFTTNLVSELNGTNKGTLNFNNDSKNTAKHRVWIYIDENVNVYDKLLGATDGVQSSPSDGYTVGKNMYRLGRIDVEYSGEDTKKVSLNMQQWNLWRVWNKDRTRYYDIEHEEEYLNNYASDQGYGQTQNGMPWGLNNIELSHTYPAAVLLQNGEDIITWLINNVGKYIGFDSVEEMAEEAYKKSIVTYYDFYLSRDVEGLTEKQIDKLEVRDYSGITYNKEIASYLKQKYASHQQGDNYDATIDKLILTDKPKSAFAYCYNKNKRNSDGTVNVNDIHWFLPAIDEIEDIAYGAYSEFDKVFQKEKYWSCQPAYDKKFLNLELTYNFFGTQSAGYLQADYYNDNLQRARATSIEVAIENGVEKPENISSASPGISGTQNGVANIGWYKIDINKNQNGGYVSIAIPEQDYKNNTPGNLLRTSNARIRAVYRSGSTSAQ